MKNTVPSFHRWFAALLLAGSTASWLPAQEVELAQDPAANDTSEALGFSAQETLEEQTPPPLESGQEGEQADPADKQPDDPRLAEAMDLMQRQEYLEASRLFLQLLKEFPENRMIGFNLSTALIESGRHALALDVLQVLYNKNPNDYFVINNLAWVLATTPDLASRDGQRAIQLAQEALLLRPNSYHVWSTLSEAYYVSGNYEKAFRAAQTALQLGQMLNADAKNKRAYINQYRKTQKALETVSLME